MSTPEETIDAAPARSKPRRLSRAEVRRVREVMFALDRLLPDGYIDAVLALGVVVPRDTISEVRKSRRTDLDIAHAIRAVYLAFHPTAIVPELPPLHLPA